ncbi:MAG: nucleotidyltransferase domain-containing protein [Nitrospirae bacterium]|nr:nucleotidyltransferase domain-containing protein [Nitrospirota bacterium]
MKATEKSVFDRIVSCYKEYLKDNLISIVQFGSRARGDAKETSDYALFIIAKELPAKPFRRVLFIRDALRGRFDEKICIIAKTQEEVLNDFPQLYLNLALDGIILFDRDDFFKELQIKIKEIIQKAGLQRKRDNGEFYWEWQNPPKKGWEITWSGYRAF